MPAGKADIMGLVSFYFFGFHEHNIWKVGEGVISSLRITSYPMIWLMVILITVLFNILIDQESIDG